MKKIFVFILSIAYLATSTGATVHLHYCVDKLVEQNILQDDNTNCSNCGMDKTQQDNGCCKHEQKQLKIDQPSSIPDLAFKILSPDVAALPVSFIEVPAVALSSITEENPVSNAPPRSSDIAIYKRNCVYLI